MKKNVILLVLSLILISFAWGTTVTLIDEAIQDWSGYSSFNATPQTQRGFTYTATRVEPNSASYSGGPVGRLRLAVKDYVWGGDLIGSGMVAFPEQDFTGYVNMKFTAQAVSGASKLNLEKYNTGTGNWDVLTSFHTSNTSTTDLIEYDMVMIGKTQLRLINDSAYQFNIYDILVTGIEDPTLPVELSSFMVVLNSANTPMVTWVTQSETGVNGFYIYRGTTREINEAVLVSNLIPAHNSSMAQHYSYLDEGLNDFGTYYYWLNVRDLDGRESFHGPITLNYFFADDDPTPEIPFATKLKGAYPNPFNPNTNIGFELEDKSEVQISVFNSRGQLVRSFAPAAFEAGANSIAWDGKDNSGNSLSSGVYHIRMNVGSKSFNSKAVLMK